LLEIIKNTRYQCHLCEEKYAVKGDLNQHIRRKHKIVAPAVDNKVNTSTEEGIVNRQGSNSDLSSTTIKRQMSEDNISPRKKRARKDKNQLPNLITSPLVSNILTTPIGLTSSISIPYLQSSSSLSTSTDNFNTQSIVSPNILNSSQVLSYINTSQDGISPAIIEQITREANQESVQEPISSSHELTASTDVN